ncbi:hypothetical protein [Mycobacterium paraintracellulare]|uniref:hypothetical protein n=1 Tax=Mycobacterium paraintracellulare TaxID=1138383 RepID=UPI0019284902|nr:hypothetical protein [Mycobacterium paraintracellulare]
MSIENMTHWRELVADLPTGRFALLARMEAKLLASGIEADEVAECALDCARGYVVEGVTSAYIDWNTN